MSSATAIFLLIGIISSVLVVSFSGEIKTAATEALTEIIGKSDERAASPSLPNSASVSTNSEPKLIPDGFKGPNGEPKIIGPKSDPPNY